MVKNNFAKVFFACSYYAGVATLLCLSGVYEISRAQELVWPYLTQVQRYSRYTVQIFAVSFLKLCASLRPAFLVYSPHKYCQGTDKCLF